MSWVIQLPAAHLHVGVSKANTLKLRSTLHPKQALPFYPCGRHHHPPILTTASLSLMPQIQSITKPWGAHLRNAFKMIRLSLPHLVSSSSPGTVSFRSFLQRLLTSTVPGTWQTLDKHMLNEWINQRTNPTLQIATLRLGEKAQVYQDGTTRI